MTPRYTRKDADKALERLAKLLGLTVGYGAGELSLDYSSSAGGYIVNWRRNETGPHNLVGRDGFTQQDRYDARQLCILADDLERLHRLGLITTPRV